MQMNHAPHWWSWADIIWHADQLGVPNFQRGAVWDSANRVALLESIYEQSPCGSFVLWTTNEDSRDPRRHGVPIYRFATGKNPMWLVDGQQRTRAMLDIFQQIINMPSRLDGWSIIRQADLEDLRSHGPLLIDSPDQVDEDVDEDAENDLHIWFVVLPSMAVFDRGREPYFGVHSESRHIRRGSMFRRLRPRSRTRLNVDGKVRNVPPHPVGLVPLATLLTLVGVFHNDDLKKDAFKGLQSFGADDAEIPRLDDLLPWGPQFVTGHTYEIPGQGHMHARPMRWADIHARRNETGVCEMVERLEGLFDPEWNTVFNQFADMFKGNRFAVGWLPPSDVSEAIDAYVRINRSGVRVRAEERALALMSRARPELLDDLSHFMQKRDNGPLVQDQRSLLAHESERQMGFSVWMTVVTRYTALALLGTYARRWLAVSAIDKDTFSYRLDRVGPKETPKGKETWARTDYETPGKLISECSDRASTALILIDEVLSEELYLDHRMARPQVRALYPMIDLFYRVPAPELELLCCDSYFRIAIARLLHWTLLAPYIDQPDLEKLVLDIHGINEEVGEKGEHSDAHMGQI